MRARVTERRGALAVASPIVAFLLAAIFAPAVAGHSLLRSSEPSASATVGTPPTVVHLVFGEAADPHLSVVTVVDAAGHNHVVGPLTVDPANPLELDAAVDALSDGVYDVSWRTVSALDGHSALGRFSFGVGVSPPAAAGDAAEPPTGLAATTPLDLLSRLLLYAGLIAMFGGGIVALLIVPARASVAARLGVAGAVLAAIGGIGVVAIQWTGTNAGLSVILGTSLGLTGIARLVIAGLGIVAAVWLTTASRRGAALASPLVAVVVIAGLGMAADVATGHAASVQPVVLQVAFGWFHVAAAGFWIGGLAALLLTVRGAEPDVRAGAARRFSIVAGLAIAIVAVTGALRAIAEVGTLDELLATDYGRIVILKGGLIVVLALLGATNHFWSVPVAGSRFARLRRIGTTELTIAITAVALTAALVDLAPPVSLAEEAAPPAPPAISSGTDAAGTVRVRLVVSPGTPGTNDIAAAVTRISTGVPLDASAVSLRFELASGAGVAASTLDVARTQAGTYTATGANLSTDGIWKVTASVTSSAETVEVPLVIATVVPDEPVDVNTSPGVPTIYVVHLGDGRTVQLYLDPETAGKDEVHVTFFDAAGTELPIASATMAIQPASGPAQVLATRQLEPGHYVADTDLPAGPLVVDAVGPDPATGAPIHVHATLTVQP